LTIAGVVETFHRALPDAALFVIDNRSTDGTGTLAKETFIRLGCTGEVLYETRPGKGYAVSRAFQDIQADIYVLVDGDATYHAADLADLLKPVTEGVADMVIGDRISEGQYQGTNARRFHQFGNALVKWLINFLFEAQLQDILTGYRVFNRKFVKSFPSTSRGFEIETEMTLHALDQDFRIVSIPVQYRDRPLGSESKLRTISDGILVLRTIMSIFKDYRPLLFFSALSLIAFLTGLAIGFPVISEFLATRYITKIPSAILASGVIIIAVMLLAVGLILDSVVKINRRNFRLWLLREE
ncbi:MAG: glycosyltransferase family 2 protein, partial [Candidatus Margulisiibacteriota bacterium]